MTEAQPDALDSPRPSRPPGTLVGVLRGTREVRTLGTADREAALELCALDPAAGVYVAARIGEVNLEQARGALLGYFPQGRLSALCWASANIVPVNCDEQAAEAFARQLRRHQHRYSSIFGPQRAVEAMWRVLQGSWRAPREIRNPQLLMAFPPGQATGVAPDPRVRQAAFAELDILAPAAAAMFEEEIGYPPFRDVAGRIGYRNNVRTLISRGHSFVLVQDEQVIFKADIGSAGVGAAQIQGVWVDPAMRGRGIAAPAMAAVVELASQVAPLVTLYVNDFNHPAIATYERVGFDTVGAFATILF
ncbi:GNAT family N-acetyltransferase [Gephyromycinifex aptenodytis]|uniref:GNAT family N-acetyltransferase n=1 Tax=Gephyromycinifex aptenodytis TaxID=2716227 RepID=UPI001444BDDE|nr:GNAT family N-acetyltransferase [Gephyromycinifex aptenodytis]